MVTQGLKKLAITVLVCTGVYALLGFLVAPYVVERGLQQTVSNLTGRDVRVEAVQFNPFTFAVRTGALALVEPNGTALLTIARTYANFTALSLLGRASTLQALVIERPELSLELFDGGENDLSRLLAAIASQRAAENGRTTLDIEHTEISDGRVHLVDRSRGPASLTLDAITISARDLSTHGDTPGHFTLHARHPPAGRLELGGELVLASLTSSGAFELAELDLRSLDPWLEGRAPLGDAEGMLSLAGEYSLSGSGDGRKLRLNAASAVVRDLHLQPGPNTALLGRRVHIDSDVELDVDQDAFRVHLGELALRGEGLELRDAAASSGLLSVDELRLSSARAAWQDGKLNASGELSLSQVSLTDPARDERVFGADAIDALGLVVDTAPVQVTADVARLHRPDLTLVLDAEGALHRPAWVGALISRVTAAVDGNGNPRERSVFALDRLEFADARVDFVDSRLDPPLEIRADEVRGAVGGLVSGTEGTATLEVEARLNDSARSEIAGRWLPGNPRRSSALEVVLRDVDGSLMSPYATRFTGRETSARNLRVELRLQIDDYELAAEQQMVLEDLSLGDPVERPDSVDLPLDLAIALLEDSSGHIQVAVPVSGNLRDPDFSLANAMRNALASFVSEVAGAPFEVLAELAGATATELSAIPFAPGSAAITPPAVEQLAVLAGALHERPRLGLRATGGYDPEVDGSFLARQQVRLHVALATSEKPPAQTDPGPLAFADPKTQSVLDEFAAARLTPARLAAIRSRVPVESPATDDETATGSGQAYYQAVFEALVANETISDLALKSLARYRAQSVVSQLASLGVAGERLQLAQRVEAVEAQSRDIAVRLALELFASGADPARETQ